MELLRRVFPVVTYQTRNDALDQAMLVLEMGADGVMISAEQAEDAAVIVLAADLKRRQQRGESWDALAERKIGIKLRTTPALWAIETARKYGLDLVWESEPGIRTAKPDYTARELQARLRSTHRDLLYFGGVDTRTTSGQADCLAVARLARQIGIVPLGMADAAGPDPSTLHKLADEIQEMPAGTGRLAVLHGLNVTAIDDCLDYANDLVLTTAFTNSNYRLERECLAEIIEAVRSCNERLIARSRPRMTMQ